MLRSRPSHAHDCCCGRTGTVTYVLGACSSCIPPTTTTKLALYSLPSPAASRLLGACHDDEVMLLLSLRPMLSPFLPCRSETPPSPACTLTPKLGERSTPAPRTGRRLTPHTGTATSPRVHGLVLRFVRLGTRENSLKTFWCGGCF